jgi:hypothetical protein
LSNLEEIPPSDEILRALRSVIVDFSSATTACSLIDIDNRSIPVGVIEQIASHGAREVLSRLLGSNPQDNPLVGIPGIDRLKHIVDKMEGDKPSSLTIAIALFLSLGKVTGQEQADFDRAIDLSNAFTDTLIRSQKSIPLTVINASKRKLRREPNIRSIPTVFNESARTSVTPEMMEVMNNDRLRRGLMREWVVATLSQRLEAQGIKLNASRIYNLTHYKIAGKPNPEVPSVAYNTLKAIYDERPITHTVPDDPAYKFLRELIEERKITKQDFRTLCKSLVVLDVRSINTIYDWVRDNKGSAPLDIVNGIREHLIP